MSQIEEEATNPHGEALVEELLWIHGIIRSNLEQIRAITAEVNVGAPAEQVHLEIKEMISSSVLWTLRVGCLRYCILVHSHHNGEDTLIFPGLRRANPSLNPVIDKLEADHAVVATYLDEVEAAAARLLEDETARAALAEALEQLADTLIVHLDYEETNLSPTLRTLDGWPIH